MHPCRRAVSHHSFSYIYTCMGMVRDCSRCNLFPERGSTTYNSRCALTRYQERRARSYSLNVNERPMESSRWKIIQRRSFIVNFTRAQSKTILNINPIRCLSRPLSKSIEKRELNWIKITSKIHDINMKNINFFYRKDKRLALETTAYFIV